MGVTWLDLESGATYSLSRRERILGAVLGGVGTLLTLGIGGTVLIAQTLAR